MNISDVADTGAGATGSACSDDVALAFAERPERDLVVFEASSLSFATGSAAGTSALKSPFREVLFAGRTLGSVASTFVAVFFVAALFDAALFVAAFLAAGAFADFGASLTASVDFGAFAVEALRLGGCFTSTTSDSVATDSLFFFTISGALQAALKLGHTH